MVGIGYAGVHAITHMKRLVGEREHRIDNHRIKYLAVELANERYFPSPNCGDVQLNKDERLDLNTQLEPIIEEEIQANTPLYPWLQAYEFHAGGVRPDLQQGTGNQRAVARLALYENLNVIQDRVRPKLSQLVQQSADENKQGIDIVLSCSTGGGTGSGMVLDMCWLLRKCIEELGISANISLVLSAPLVENGAAFTDIEQTIRLNNHQALMREVDRISAMRGELLAPMQSYPSIRNWFDNIMCVGPASYEACSGPNNIYPQTAEILFNWVLDHNDQGLSAYFYHLNSQSNNVASSSQDGRQKVIHRLEPTSIYVYPKTVKRYLILSSLRKWFAQLLWGKVASVNDYHAFAYPADNVEKLLNTWKVNIGTDHDQPWLLQVGNSYETTELLRQRLMIGTGPSLYFEVDPLTQAEFVKQQTIGLSNLLDSVVSKGLNEGVDGICEPHGLAVHIQALDLLVEQLKNMVNQANTLIEAEVEPLVEEESKLMIELAEQAQSPIKQKISTLLTWDQYFGEGIKQLGVMRYFDYQFSMVKEDIGDLMLRTSPRLPFSWEQIDALEQRYIEPVVNQLITRMQWQPPYDEDNSQWQVLIQGEQSQYWRIEDLADNVDDANPLAEAIIQLTLDVASDIDNWDINQYAEQDISFTPAPTPRVGNLNAGAKGLYLVQSQRGIGNLHCDIKQLDVAEPTHLSSTIACEQKLTSDMLWIKIQPETLPYIFDEEHFGYAAYDYYCYSQGLTNDNLPASILGLCREPKRFLAFINHGLVQGKITEQQDGYESIWVADIDGESIQLASDKPDGIQTFIQVANAWIEKVDLSTEKEELIEQQQLQSSLTANALFNRVEQPEFTDKLLGVVSGMRG